MVIGLIGDSFSVTGPNGRVLEIRCETNGEKLRTKSLRDAWWRAPLVARCRKEWGDGTLVPLGGDWYKWVTD